MPSPPPVFLFSLLCGGRALFLVRFALIQFLLLPADRAARRRTQTVAAPLPGLAAAGAGDIRLVRAVGQLAAVIHPQNQLQFADAQNRAVAHDGLVARLNRRFVGQKTVFMQRHKVQLLALNPEEGRTHMHLFIRHADIAAHRSAERPFKRHAQLCSGREPSAACGKHDKAPRRARLRQIPFHPPPERAVFGIFFEGQQHNQRDDRRAEIAKAHGRHLIPSLIQPCQPPACRRAGASAGKSSLRLYHRNA